MVKSPYDRQWRKRRAEQLEQSPLCALHLERGELVPATVADHIVPHKGDPVLFEGPLQSLCATCHNSSKQTFEKSGAIRGCDLRGHPFDPRHPWNAR